MHYQCTLCSSSYEITPSDLSFYEKISPEFGTKKYSIPPPTLCPDCRLQRRLAWRVERNLYFRTCDLTGERIPSIIAPDSPHKAYHHEAWYGPKWSALDYGRDFDFSRPFFEQFSALMRDVPLLALNVIGVQNCEYVNQTGFSKNCYFTIEADENQDCMYSYRIFFSRSCVDCLEVVRSELLYECVDCDRSFHLFWSQLCTQCTDSSFLFDCRGCQHCFGCTGLRQKQYCLFNEQLKREQYEEAMRAFDFCNPAHIEAARAQFEERKLAHPRKAFAGEQNDNVSGNYIYESKDSFDSFGLRGCRDCRYCNLIRSAKDCMDYFVWGEKAERIYECECCGVNLSALSFCCDCWEGSHDLLYCYQCVLSTAHCFGCVGIQHGSYCILNKQYSEQEYEQLVPRIIEHMTRTGEYGEFFPAAIAPYAYNETTAEEYFPLTKAEVLGRGLRWKDDLPFTTGRETIGWDQISYDIRQVPDSITDVVLACEATGKNFRITSKELQFYRDQNLPIPHFHHDERHRRRTLVRNPRRLWDRQCAKCGKGIQTSYAPERPEIVYCEECYLKEVY